MTYSIDFTEEEIASLISTIEAAPVGGYGDISKNKTVYTMPIRKMANKVKEKLNQAIELFPEMIDGTLKDYVVPDAETGKVTHFSMTKNGLRVSQEGYNISFLYGYGFVSVINEKNGVITEFKLPYMGTENTQKTLATTDSTAALTSALLTQEKNISQNAEKISSLETEIKEKVASVYRYKGSVVSFESLPTSGLTVGDVYNVQTAHEDKPAGANYAWTGSEWDSIGGDFLNYYTKTEAKTIFVERSEYDILQATVSQNEKNISQNVEKISVNARNIQSLLAMQAKTVMEQTLTDSYTARQTADGALNIVDGALTYPTKISGKTVKTTNLFDDSDFINKPLGTFSSGKMSFKISAGTYTAIIKTKNVVKIQPNVTTLKLNDNTGICIIDILNTENATTINSFNNVVTFTVSTEQASVIKNVTFFFNSGNGADYVGDEIAYIMINEGTSIKPYSPYFNGLKHAYFKGVRSIGRQLLDRNDFTIIDGNKYAYSVKALSLEKNYYIAANSAVIKYVKISVNTWSEWNVSFGSDWGSDYKQKAYFTTTKYGGNSTNPLTFDGKYIYIWIVDTANGVNRIATPEDIEKYEIMIYEGASDEYAYEEYKDDTSFFYTEAQGLKEWDYLLPQEGKKGEQTGVVTFDGSENWVEAPNTSKGYVRFYVGVSGLLPTSGTKTDNLVCNLYPNVSLSDAYHNGTNGIHSDENVSTIYFIDSNYSTIAEWKAHLAELAAAGNPLTVAYKTATATETDLKPERASYFANNKGQEIVDEGETKNSEYGAKVTIEQDYAVWIGGEE